MMPQLSPPNWAATPIVLPRPDPRADEASLNCLNAESLSLCCIVNTLKKQMHTAVNRRMQHQYELDAAWYKQWGGVSLHDDFVHEDDRDR